MSAVSARATACPHPDPDCWCSPLSHWPADSDRWAAFCLEINARIQRTRRLEGRDDLGTFDPPIPANVEVRALPDGRVAPLPANQGQRDERGRFLTAHTTSPEQSSSDDGWLFVLPKDVNDPVWPARVRAEAQRPRVKRKAGA